MPTLQNPRHETFAQSVARGRPLVEAYVIAGYPRHSANASTLAAIPSVKRRIERVRATVLARLNVTADRTLAELARIAFADITEIVQVVKGKVRIAPMESWSLDMRAAVAEIRKTPDGVTIKLHDKGRALELLAKHLGLMKENVDLNVNVSLLDLVTGSYKLEGGKLIERPAAARGLIARSPEETQLVEIAPTNGDAGETDSGA